MSDMASIAAAHGWERARIMSNGRTTPEGVRLHWQWLGPSVKKFGLAFPFFIDWLDSPHPTESLEVTRPDAVIRLQHFAVGHPDAPDLGRILTELGAPIETYTAAEVQFQVGLQTPLGFVSL